MPQVTPDDLLIYIYERGQARTRDLERQFVKTRMMSRGTMYKYKRQLELEGRIQAKPVAAKPPYHLYFIPPLLLKDVVAIKERRRLQLQKREQTLQDRYWSILPKHIVNILDPNEHLYYVYYHLNRLYYVVTDTQVISWMHFPSDMFAIENTEYWLAKYVEIVNVSQPTSRLGPDGTHHTIKIETTSQQARILDFDSDSIASWEAYRKLEEAYLHYLANGTEIPNQRLYSNPPQQVTNENHCPRCQRDFSALPTTIRYCPFCGQRARTRNTRIAQQEEGPFTKIFE
ncbi:MAG: hypothetical protein NWE83_04390 [Candidatus Bathyarchaeota archaeon]|nr:hypothetical protein [Candidatus Bathyarchaeota archaeon]